MKILLSLVGLFLLLCFVSAEVRINEIELNPNDSCNDCTERIELYSDNEINLTNWHISDASGKNHTLNFTFNGYIILNNLNISLNNANEQLFLYNGTQLIHNTSILSDSDNNNFTWQYCSENWTFIYETPGSLNNCTTISTLPTCTINSTCNSWSSCTNSLQTRTCTNTSSDCSNISYSENQTCTSPNTPGTPTTPEITLDLDWNEEDIINGDEFAIDVEAFNLQNYDYDLKIYIHFEDNDTIISDRYDEDNDTWKSGTYYLDKVFSGTGNKTESVSLRIRSTYSEFHGDAKIYAKIVKNGNSAVIAQKTKNIEIKEKAVEDSTDSDNSDDSSTSPSLLNSESETPNNDSAIIKQIISLGSQNKIIQGKENSIIYKSKTEYIKEYAPYLFSLVCIFIIAILIIDRNRD